MRRLIGFNAQDKSTWKYYDTELVKRDLTNEFMTRRGERLKLPNYGSVIWNYIMEPKTETVKDIIVDDAIRIINNDSRVSLVSINVFDEDHGYILEIILKYVFTGTEETFRLSFEQLISENNL